ncbi:MAG: hypothetical protein KDK78_09765, partial [Chlamydiia bacterium]|nr:hypothetical protein [Chlamydiia bacterium]
LETMRIAIPGEHTSAHLLFKALVPPAKELVFCRYDEVTSKIKSGEVDAGVIIHETRFCFADSGLVELCDLGALWEYRYQCPVPLGCLVASRDLDVRTVEKLITALQSSLQYAWDHPAASEVFVATHAQELSSEVIRKHIELYVSDETMQLSADAQKGIATFLQLADPSLEQTSYASDWLFVTEAGLPS